MSFQREQEVYLIISPKHHSALSVRVTTRAGRLAADEVAMRLTIRVPDAIFKRPALAATVTIPQELVNRPSIDAAVVDNIKAELQRTLGVDLSIQVVEPQS